MKPIDPCALALSVGATFIARSFSGDKKQLVSLIKAGIKHKGFALIDVISPCVSFNDHKGSTKSYAHTFKYYHKAVHADYVPPSAEIRASYEDGQTMPIELHDGGVINLRKLDSVIYIDEKTPDMATRKNLPSRPLNTFPYAELNPGNAALKDMMKEFS